MSAHSETTSANSKFLSPGALVLLALMAVGLFFVVARFLFGLGSVTNLNNQYPWGIWIGIDVASGGALTAGGFTAAFLVSVLHRGHYKAVVRPALLTAMLGYTFVVLTLLVDIGRYWNIWRPVIHWNGDSVLFEAGVCVILYLIVLYIEFIPIAAERFMGQVNLPGVLALFNGFIESLLSLANRIVGKVMWFFIIAGVVLSCLYHSSLGSLMLIAPHKIHPLWYTPILPLLFLLSAIGVGFPMVVFESIITAKSFKREPKMEVLTPLAAFIPVLIGLYLVFKIGDIIVRGSYTFLLDGTFQTNAFLVETVFGLILPFVLLLFKKVRQSTAWLFFASTFYIGGVILNRINVFLVSYSPPYQIKSYFPSIGEIAIIVGMISALIFLCRVFVFVFPVLGINGKKTAAKTVPVILVSILTLGVISVPRLSNAAESANKPLPYFTKTAPSLEKAPNFSVLDSPVIKKYDDLYEPVRFMHFKHANLIQDCTICHHRIQRQEGDIYGEPAKLRELIGQENLIKGCSACHADPFDPTQLHKPGLKGAYHQRCLNCHQESEQKTVMVDPVRYRALVKGLSGARSLVSRAPVDCISCHAKKVPDHKNLVKIKGEVDALSITRNCLSCHETQANDILKSSHWNWQGSSPFTLGNEIRNDLGKRSTVINNSFISLKSNWAGCTGCHIGYGWQDKDFDFNEASKIDCLVCHDKTGEYRKSVFGAGFPEKEVNLLKVAQNVGRPDRNNCGTNCHFSGGPSDPVKHGHINATLLKPSREADVHMDAKGINLRCQDCHFTRNHRISGRSIATPATEGYLSCEFCHTRKPHRNGYLLTHHLNKHIDHVACQTCHIPVYSRAGKTRTRWDWSTARQGKKFGTIFWEKTVKPAYLWYNGMVKRHLAGDRINEPGVTELTKPQGSFNDPASRIFPFKVMTGRQISDAVHKNLITPKLWKGFWQHWDWDRAAKEGLKESGLLYSGQYQFVETIAYQGLNHEVLPRERSLSCVDCHQSLADEKACGRCHEDQPGIDFKALVRQRPELKDAAPRTGYMDFEALGYAGDPVETGGRFKALPLKLEDRAKRK